MDLHRRVDAASLIVLRVAVGLLLFVSAARFVARGWVESLLLAPSFHFHYWGFAWVDEPAPWLAYALFGLLAAAGLALAAGLATRTSAGLALFAFAWIELVDLTYYLNHYYFLTCLLATFVLVPPRAEADGRVPAWKLALVRTQVGMVYVYAGLAKLGGDWLLHAQPLDIWLARHADLPVIGRWLDEAWLAYAASWTGAAFDLLVVPALVWARTRPWAYAAVVGFHVATGLLFPIGMFPWFMIASATILFPPEWPRRWLSPGARLDRPHPSDPRVEAALGWLAAALLLVQLALPWRTLLYPGSPLWHEQGFRYGYRVMLVEKAAMIEFRVRDRSRGREWRVDPADELTPLQARMLGTQPDLILQYAHHLAARLEHELPGSAIEVRVDAFVSLHGRPARRLIDPSIDLARERDGLAAKPWILPGPEEPPP
ncbi:HTTM domain-containing protein [Nannocystaceae bacterium ST9]